MAGEIVLGVFRPAPIPRTGLDFDKENAEADSNMRFDFAGAARPQRYPRTMTWRITPRQQTGFFCTFFYTRWLTPSSFVGDASYEGCHLYPYGGTHHWEISYLGTDTPNTLGGVDDNGNSTAVEWDREYIQAERVYLDGSGNLIIKFYYDIANGMDKVITATISAAHLAATGAETEDHALVFASSPWTAINGGNANTECMNSLFRALKIFEADLGEEFTEAEALDDEEFATEDGQESVHYMNLNPTPDDISDKSGQGNDPGWANALRPELWEL